MGIVKIQYNKFQLHENTNEVLIHKTIENKNNSL